MQYHASASLFRKYITMATTKPRITITMEQPDYDVVQRLAKLQGKPMSKVVTELISEIVPVLAKVADSLAIAVNAHANVKQKMVQAAEQAEQDMQPVLEQAINQFDLFASQLAAAVEGESAAAAPVAAASAAGGADVPSPRPVITGAMKPQRGLTDSKGDIQKAAEKKSKSSRSGASLRAK
jgi:predicted transcriptional regulator